MRKKFSIDKLNEHKHNKKVVPAICICVNEKCMFVAKVLKKHIERVHT